MATQPRQLWWEELVVGQVFDFGSKTMTKDEIVDFAVQFDPQPFHIDEEAAKANPMFGRLCASGVHSFAVTSRLIYDGFYQTGIVPLGGGGLDHLRFLAPVFPGDVVSLQCPIAELRALSSRPERGLVRIAPELRNQDDVPVLSYEGIFFLARRPNG